MLARDRQTNQFKKVYVKALDSLPVGVSVEYAGDTIPSEMEGTWMFERGQELNRTEYADLFSRIGTKYGAGNGTTTFNLPNRCGRVTVGLDSNDSDFDELGKTGGSKYIQKHIHKQLKWYNQPISYDTGTGAHFQGNLGINNGNGTTSVNMTTGDVSDVTTGNSGNLQPYIVKNYIIKVKETTPRTSETVNTFSNSTKNAYSCDYVNDLVEEVYSTDEVKTNKVWIDGKPIYRKVYNFGTLPNTSTKTVAHNISNLDNIINATGFAKNASGNVIIMPNSSPSNMIYNVQLSANNTEISVSVGNDRSAYTICYITLEYTKTTIRR